MTDAKSPVAKPGIMDIAPYVGGKSTIAGVAEPMKLSSNENALGAGARAREAYEAALKNIHIYPDGRAGKLRDAVAKTSPDSFLPVRLRRNLSMEEMQKVEEWKLELPGGKLAAVAGKAIGEERGRAEAKKSLAKKMKDSMRGAARTVKKAAKSAVKKAKKVVTPRTAKKPKKKKKSKR